MANDPIFTELENITLKEVYPRVVEDSFFRDTPRLAYMRDHCLAEFRGGAFMQFSFRYAPMIGGAYAPGATFNITQQQTLAAAIFLPKYYEVNVTEYKEEIQVLNKGELAVFKRIDEDLTNAIQTLNAIVAIDLYNHGQAAGSGITGNRPNNINGDIEIVADGLNPSWDGSVMTAYGTQPRNGTVGIALNSTPRWCGDSAGNTGPITYPLLEEAYQDATQGRDEPNLGVTSKAGIAFIKERIQPQQRFAQEKDPIWGVTGFRMNSAMILRDDYIPSAIYGVNDPNLGNYLTSTFTVPSTVTSASGLPVATTVCTVGELFWWYNTKKYLLRVSDDPEYGFGFSGFVPAQDNTRVAGQVKAGINVYCTAPRLQKLLYGIGS